MELKISQSVGVVGRNQVQDVALVQLMLKLLHRGSGGSGPYFKGEINGLMQGPTTGAILTFFKDVLPTLPEAKRKGIKISPPLLTPNGVMFQQLVSYVKSNPMFCRDPRWTDLVTLEPIKDTPFFYWPGNTPERTTAAKDYLIPDLMQPNREITIGSKDTFTARFEEVRLLNNDHLEVDFSLRGIAHFMHPISLKKEWQPSSKRLLAYLVLAQQGSDWKLVTGKKSPKGQYTVVSKKSTGLRKAVQYWRRQDFYGRVFAQGEKHHLIPAFDDAAKLVALAQAGVCAARTMDVSKPSEYEVVAKFVGAVSLKKLGVTPEVWEAHCGDCEALLQDLVAYSEQAEALSDEAAKLAPQLSELRRYLNVIQSYEQLDAERKNALGSVLLGLAGLPLEGDVLFSDKIAVSDDDLVKYIGEAALKLEPKPQDGSPPSRTTRRVRKMARATIFLSRIMEILEVGEAIFRTIQVIGLKDDYNQAVAWVRAEGPYVRQRAVDLQYQLDGVRLQVEALYTRREARGCGTG